MSNTANKLSPPLQQWFDKGELIELQGNNIFAIDEGDQSLPVIVLIHGFPTSTWDFEGVWKALSANHRLVCLDMLGFGFSDKPNQRNYQIHHQADLIDALVERLQIPEYHIFAHDYGVSVAQELLARQQDQTAASTCLSCCFLNGGLFPETHQALLIQKIMLSRFGKYVNKLTGFGMFCKSFSKVFGPETKPSEPELRLFWEVINYNQGRHAFHNLITYMSDRITHRERWLSALQHAQMPLGVINGSMDPVSGAHLVTRYKELNCRLDYLAQLPTIGHYPQTEDPHSVAKHYLEFLEEVSTNG